MSPEREPRVTPTIRHWISEEARVRVGEGRLAECELDRFVDETAAAFVGGEPLQYLLGRWQFRGIELTVDRRALIPRPETESMVDIALRLLPRTRASRVVEIGVGSGALSLALAVERQDLSVLGTEISLPALTLAQENRAMHVEIAPRVEFRLGSLFDAVGEEERATFDLVLSNPPYLSPVLLDSASATVRAYEPYEALAGGGADGLDVLRRIVAEAPLWLRDGGGLLLEHSPEQSSEILDLLRTRGFRDPITHADLAGRDRFTHGIWR